MGLKHPHLDTAQNDLCMSTQCCLVGVGYFPPGKITHRNLTGSRLIRVRQLCLPVQTQQLFKKTLKESSSMGLAEHGGNLEFRWQRSKSDWCKTGRPTGCDILYSSVLH